MTRRPISCSRINTSPLHDYVRLVRLNKGPVCNASLLNVCGSMFNTYSLRQDTLFPVHSSQPDTHRESSQWSQSQTSGQTPGHFQHQKYMCTVFTRLDSTTIWHVQFSRGSDFHSGLGL